MGAGGDGGRWLTVTALTLLLAAVAALATVTSVVDADHVWVLTGLTVAAAASRACGHGGPRSVLILATSVLVMQPALHLVGELTDDPAGHHGGLVGLLVVVSHVALSAVLVALMAAIDVAAVAVSAALRRLARFLTWWATTTPDAATTVVRCAPGDEQAYTPPVRALQPPRRGPPAVMARS